VLTPQPASRPRQRGRIAVALAGGGPLGAFYEIGALQALAEGIDGLDLCDLYAYVGVSSGAMLAAGLANDLTPVDIGRIVITNDAGHEAAEPSLFLRPAFREYGRRVAGAPRRLLTGLGRLALWPLSGSLAEVLEPLTGTLPAGIFDNGPFERYLSRLFTSGGRSNDFRRLRHRLVIVAADLNTGAERLFGATADERVPISQAVQASTALPGLYTPVTIDGHAYVDGALLRTMHASVVLEAGADLVFCINPLVSFDASAGGRQLPDLDLTRHGLPVVLGQTFRSLIQSRMLVGVAAYRRRFPHADILLFEPDRGDRRMFFATVFRYTDRRRLVDHAYQCTRRDLLRSAPTLAPVLARHGLRLRRDVLADPQRSFHAALERQRRANRRVAQTLAATLDRLEAQLASSAAGRRGSLQLSRTDPAARWSGRGPARSRR